ncbi:MAG: hypothetical protein IJQ03_00420 [Firmicutes bacterium]|nr:hypothetical protein [Bacillota bacterium]
MLDRNSDLRAFQARAREACAAEFTTIQTFAKALGLGRDVAYKLLAGIPNIRGKYLVDDMAERIFNELHPKAKRCG